MRKIKYLILPILLVLSFTVTYALYTSSSSGNSSVQAANFVVTLVTNNNTIDITNGSQNINFGSCEDFKPGDSCEIPFRIDATNTEVDTVVTLEIGNIIGATEEQLDKSGISFKISDGINEGYSYNLRYGEYKNLSLIIDWELGNINDEEKPNSDLELSKIQNNIEIPVNIVARQVIGEKITIALNSNGGNIDYATKDVTFGFIYGELPIPTKNNYSFIGWNTKKDGTGNFIVYDSLVSNQETHTLYAIWDSAYASATEAYNRFHTTNSNYIKCDVNVNNKYYNCSNENEISSSNNKTIIILNKDINQNISLTNEEYIIDLYGNSLTGNITTNNTDLSLKSTSLNKGIVNIISSFTIVNTSNVELENVRINLNSNNNISPYASTITLRNSEIISSAQTGSSAGNSNLWMHPGSTANIYDSYIYGPYAIGGQGGTINVYNSTIDGFNRNGIQVNSGYCADITINGDSKIIGKQYGIYIMTSENCTSTLELNGDDNNKPYILGKTYSSLAITNASTTFTFNYGNLYGKNNIVNQGTSIYRTGTSLKNENVNIDGETYIHTYLSLD